MMIKCPGEGEETQDWSKEIDNNKFRTNEPHKECLSTEVRQERRISLFYSLSTTMWLCW